MEIIFAGKCKILSTILMHVSIVVPYASFCVQSLQSFTKTWPNFISFWMIPEPATLQYTQILRW